MDEELINLAVVEQVIQTLALALPAAGLLVGLLGGVIRRRAAAGAAQGLLIGLAGPVVWLLWRVYNAIEDHYGLDSVKALLINLALFLAVGVIAGAIIGWCRRPSGESQE